MPKYLNNEMSQLALIYESGTYGSVSGAGVWLGMVQDHSVSEDEGVMPMRYVGGVTRGVEQFDNGPKTYTGNFSYYPQDWRMLKFVLGQCADAGSPSPFTHAYTLSEQSATAKEFASQVLPSFTLEDAHTYTGAGSNFIRTINGCVVNTYSINITAGEPVSCSVDYTAKSNVFSSGAKTSITDPALSPFFWQQFAVQITSGTSVSEVNSCSITVNNNLNPKRYLTSGQTIANIIPAAVDYEIALDINETADTMKTYVEQYWQGGSAFNLLVVGTLSAGSRAISMTFSGCRITAFNSPTTAEGENRATMTVRPKTLVVVEDSLDQFYNAGSYA